MRYACLLVLLVLPPTLLAADKQEWTKGLPYTTDWKEAIREVSRTGKLLFIYNGWKRPGI